MERAQARGFIGPGPLEPHLSQANAFGEVVRQIVPAVDAATIVDLGSGGGLPGLVLIDQGLGQRWWLVEAMEKRAVHLAVALEEDLGVTGHLVLHQRAEELGRDPERRHGADVVIARLFGSPAATAECSAPLLRPGGVLIVSEPPGRPSRWPAEGVALVGMEPGDLVERDGMAFQVLHQSEPCGDAIPRAIGRPAKRPLF